MYSLFVFIIQQKKYNWYKKLVEEQSGNIKYTKMTFIDKENMYILSYDWL